MPKSLFTWRRERCNSRHGANDRLSVKVLHSFYRSTQPSGENEAVLRQVELLAQSGFDVELIYLSSDDLESKHSAKLLTAVGLAMGKPTAKPPLGWFADAHVLHIHNTFPAMSHEWLGNIDIPKVMTAHNYRAFCANGLFLRDGKRCMDCTTQGSSRAVVHGCYRDSRAQSIPIAMQQSSSRSLTNLMDKCYRVLLPGEPMQGIFQEFGLNNTQVLPHPVVAAPTQSGSSAGASTWLFVGRISPEKGLADLLRIWPSSEALIVIGDGPDRQQAERITLERNLSVRFQGSQDSQGVQSMMSRSRGLIFPSKALEGAPLVYAEAMQSGLPLVAAEGSTLAIQIVTDQTGAIFTWDSPPSLDSALKFVDGNREVLAHQANTIYRSRYTPEVWITNITEIYKSAISAHKGK